MIAANAIIFGGVTASWNSSAPNTTVPTEPIPVHTV